MRGGTPNLSLILWNGLNFDPQVTLTVGNHPDSVAIGDADNDGDNDILATNRDDCTVSLIRWNGSGFDPQFTMAAGTWPVSVVVGDADNDGDNDIAAANVFSDDVTLLLWNGSGFDPAISLSVGDEPHSVGIGDADNDGKNDIITANGQSHNVSFLRWNPDISPAPTPTPGGPTPTPSPTPGPEFWTRATGSANWSPRYSHTSVAFEGRIWVIGGSSYRSDVWYSSDGTDWTQATNSAPWVGREDFVAEVLNGKIFVMGGQYGSGVFRNDVWYSSNGSAWTQTSIPPWSDRKCHSSVVYDGKIWILGGRDVPGNYRNDVWYSSNGTNWTQATTSSAWSPRLNHTSVAHDGKMWLLGGEDGPGSRPPEVWSSTNGVDWTLVTDSAPWGARAAHTSVVYDGKIWILGGPDGNYKNDVWYSEDGHDWTRAVASAPWSARYDHSSVVYADKIWLMGGWDGSVKNDVWYYSEGYLPEDLVSIPTGLKATGGADSILLRWNPNPESNLVGYNIYRDTSPNGAFLTRLNITPLSVPQYFDSSVQRGVTYHYRVTAVIDTMQESDPSDPASAVAGSITAWMPDTRSPANTVFILPINLSYATGISGNGMDIQVTYDPSVLTPLEVQKTILTQDLMIIDNLSIVSGQLNISGISTSNIVITGEGHILDISFHVASGVPIGTTSLFAFANVKLFDASASELSVDHTDTAIFTVAPDHVRGDPDGDGDVDAGDALMAQAIALGKRIPTELELYASDINGDGQIDTADITIILRLAVGLPINPNGGGTGKSTQSIRSSSYNIALPDRSGDVGSVIPMLVQIDNSSDVAGMQIVFTYDPNVLELEDVTKGALTAGSFILGYSDHSGTVEVVLAAGQKLNGSAGAMLLLNFRAIGESATTTPIEISYVKLNGQYGEDLSWSNDVSMTGGLLMIDGASSVSGDWSSYR
jgi:hypothetical protein